MYESRIVRGTVKERQELVWEARQVLVREAQQVLVREARQESVWAWAREALQALALEDRCPQVDFASSRGRSR